MVRRRLKKPWLWHQGSFWEDQLSTALCSISSKFLCFNFLLDNLGSFKKLVLSLTSGIWIKYLSLSLNHFPLILLTSYLAFSCTTLQPPPYDRRTQSPILPWWWVQVSSSMAHFPPGLCEEKRGGHCLQHPFWPVGTEFASAWAP